jgi:hypothetical protein
VPEGIGERVVAALGEPAARELLDVLERSDADRGDARDLLRQDRDRAGLAAVAGQMAKPRTSAITRMSAVIPTRKALCPASAASESNSSRSRSISRSRFMA